MTIPPGLKRVVLHPGDHYATRESTLISTILGSCVAACLYDPVTGIAGMNHFLLANRRYAKNMPLNITEAGRYGVHAMELLINQMLHLGAVRANFHAKVFGGGSVVGQMVDDNFECVGDVNVRFIREFIKTEAITLDTSDLGGTQGRIIRFRTDTFSVYRKYIKTRATEKLELDEHKYWKNEVKSNDNRIGTVVIFKP